MKIRKNGVWEDYKYPIYESATDTITSLPTDIIADGQPVAAWTISGNMQQSSVPTPENPITPQETGERTGNLFDITAATFGKYVRDTDGTLGNYNDTSASDYIDVSNISTLYPQYFTEQRPVRQWAAFYDSSKTFVSGFSGYNQAIIVPNNAVYVRLTVDNNYVNNFTVSSSEFYNYEPYGIKIPISSANTTTPVYLGEVETTRKIKKLVLTGNENIVETTIGSKTIFQVSQATVSDKMYGIATQTMFCSHYEVIDGRTNLETINNAITTYNTSNNNALLIRDDNCLTLTDFTTYLAQQYAAGTPVTLWYVLATETTGIVNEPLRKIGDYADTISNVAEIPTTAGEQTFDVDTSLKPSSVEITYKGWHKHTPKEYDNGSWS